MAGFARDAAVLEWPAIMAPWLFLPMLLAVQSSAIPDLSALPAATVMVDSAKHEIVIELPTVHHVAAGTSHENGGGHHHHAPEPPVSLAVLPVGGAAYGFHVEVLDGEGRELPAELIHHFNLINPDSRELFLPISRRVLAAGRETGRQRLPWFFFGVPLEAGQRLIVVALLHNPTDREFHDVRARLVLQYTPERRPWPLFQGYPFQLDVAFPVGDKAFDLPPGRSVRTYEASPAVPGKVVAIGGHMHDHAVDIEFSDVTTGEVIWRGVPVVDSTGHLVRIPVGRMYGLTRLGVPVSPDHRYRVTVTYDNPTGAVLPDGGMGVVGGVFVPDDDVAWPQVDLGSDLYWRDLQHATRGVAVRPGAEQGQMHAHRPEHQAHGVHEGH